MSGAQHTPGPWAPFWDDIPHSDMGEGWTVNSPQYGIAICDGPADANEANARLIAAAPEGLEIAEEFLAFARSGKAFGYPPGSLQKLEQFIAKARGGEA